ncbi:MarR family transcriptional regulator [Roseovarius salis]|uniref:MarR family winged helix-turn-helix transcriptional regulator n=1 Tax=Roseovarius salis TaxID=3376063 RepID=UPI0037C6CF14
MSTTLTRTMQDSLTLDLYHAARGYQDRLTRYLSAELARRHGAEVSPSQLAFLSVLICGENTASSVARRMGLTRQAAQRQMAALADLGYLALAPDPDRRNQSLITFTKAGEQLMAQCRAVLTELDGPLRADETSLRRAIALMNATLPG